MRDSHLNKCKECTKVDNKTSNSKHEKRTCKICKNTFMTTGGEINNEAVAVTTAQENVSSKNEEDSSKRNKFTNV